MPSEKYTYSKRAARDLIEIYKKTAKVWGIAQADKYDSGLEKIIDLLADSPDLGRKVDGVKTGYQCFDYERHVIFYRKRAADIFIGRILHDRMDAKQHL